MALRQMLTAQIHIHPGDGSDGYTIATILCVNDESGDAVEGNYDVMVKKRNGPEWRGRIEGHRRSEGALRLIKKVIDMVEPTLQSNHGFGGIA